MTAQLTRARMQEEQADNTTVPFEDFYRREYAAVLAYARALTGSMVAAEDLTQDSFMAALGQWQELDDPSHWIRRVVANKVRTWWRRQKTGQFAHARLQSLTRVDSTLPEPTTDFWNEVRRLPRRQAQIVALYYLEDRPISEIAVILGCAESTARVHLARGRKTLGQRLELEE